MTKDLRNVYICDLGVAKLKSAAQDTTTTANVIGTYPYMAPELFGASKRGTAVDIYSLGCLYIELFGERKIWPGLNTAVEVMQKRSAAHIILHQPCRKPMICHYFMPSYAIAAAS